MLACNFIKKETLAQVFSCEFCGISKNTFFYRTLWWLLLVLGNSVPISAPDKEANLHLVETIDSTTDQFKALIEKARKFTVDNDFTVKGSTFQFKKTRRQS